MHTTTDVLLAGTARGVSLTTGAGAGAVIGTAGPLCLSLVLMLSLGVAACGDAGGGTDDLRPSDAASTAGDEESGMPGSQQSVASSSAGSAASVSPPPLPDSGTSGPTPPEVSGSGSGGTSAGGSGTGSGPGSGPGSSAPNACDGSELLRWEGSPAAPGDPCGPCEDGQLACDGSDALVCIDARETNACGGCAALDARPETACGPCLLDTWACDGVDAVVCDGETPCAEPRLHLDVDMQDTAGDVPAQLPARLTFTLLPGPETLASAGTGLELCVRYVLHPDAAGVVPDAAQCSGLGTIDVGGSRDEDLTAPWGAEIVFSARVTLDDDILGSGEVPIVTPFPPVAAPVVSEIPEGDVIAVASVPNVGGAYRIRVERDGEVLTHSMPELPSGVVNGTVRADGPLPRAAAPGPPADVSATRGERTDGVLLTWSAAAPGERFAYDYRVQVLYGRGWADWSPTTTFRYPEDPLGYEVRVEDGPWQQVSGGGVMHLDAGAPPGVIRPGYLKAGRGETEGEVAARVRRAFGEPGPPRHLAVRAVQRGHSSEAVEAVGWRGVGPLRAAWSSRDTVSGAFTPRPELGEGLAVVDREPPAVLSTRTWRAELSAEGAESVGVQGTGWQWIPVDDFSRGQEFICAIHEGSLSCWGSTATANGRRALGHGARTSDTGEVAVSRDWQRVVSSSLSSCAFDVEGDAWCWGTYPTAQNRPTLVPVQDETPGARWVEAYPALGRACLLDSVGGLWCAGSNAQGRIDPTRTEANFEALIRVNVPDTFVAFHLTSTNTFAVLQDGRVWCWGNRGSGSLCAAADTTEVEGHEGVYELFGRWDSLVSDGSTLCGIERGEGLLCGALPGALFSWAPRAQGSAYHRVDAGTEVARVVGLDARNDPSLCVERAVDGRVLCAGGPIVTEGPFAGEREGSWQVLWPASEVRRMEGGCAMIAGEREVLCWGRNDGNVLNAPAGVGSQGVWRATWMDEWTREAVPGAGMLALVDSDDRLHAVGDQPALRAQDPFGRMTIEHPLSFDVGGPVASVHTAGFNWCALRRDGVRVCWGANDGGAFGNDTVMPLTVATEIEDGGGWTALAMGTVHTCGLRHAGELWCWGSGDDGRNGDPNGQPRRLPTRLGSADDWVAISATADHTCGIRGGGDLYCWGENREGGVRPFGASGYAEPQRIARSRGTLPVEDPPEFAWVDVWTGSGQTCALAEDERLWCWGDNRNRFLASEGDPNVAIGPTVIGFGTRFSTLIKAGRSRCGVNSQTEELLCWGFAGFWSSSPASSGQLQPQRSGLYHIVGGRARGDAACIVDIHGLARCSGLPVGDGSRFRNSPSPVRFPPR